MPDNNYITVNGTQFDSKKILGEIYIENGEYYCVGSYIPVPPLCYCEISKDDWIKVAHFCALILTIEDRTKMHWVEIGIENQLMNLIRNTFAVPQVNNAINKYYKIYEIPDVRILVARYLGRRMSQK
jgi:hypothetical protein